MVRESEYSVTYGDELGSEVIFRGHSSRHRVVLEKCPPIHEERIFRLASMSKPITGAVVMMMREEGKLRLSDPATRDITFAIC